MTKEKAIEILKYIKHVGNGESEYVGCAHSMEEYLLWHERQCRKLKELG